MGELKQKRWFHETPDYKLKLMWLEYLQEKVRVTSGSFAVGNLATAESEEHKISGHVQDEWVHENTREEVE